MPHHETFRSCDGSRGALAYESAHEPGSGVRLVRFEKYPEHGDAATGWYGGRVQMRHRHTEAEARNVAMRWTEDGELPYGL